MGRGAALILLLALAAYAAPSGEGAAVEGDPELGAEVEEVEIVHQASPARGSASVTVVAVDERLPASADVASVVALSPGTVVRRLGGLGAYTTVSIRGSTARQVEVLLDGIPLNPDGAATVNLAELPLSALSRVEVYRGNAPPELGAAAVGGVVNLVSADADTARATLGVGTLGTARGSVTVGQVGERADLLVAAEGLGAVNDFRYLDDGGTVYVTDDDRFLARDNADRRQGTLHARVRIGDDRLRLTLLNALLVRDEGVPGFSFAPTGQVRYGVARDLQAVAVSGRTGAVRLQGVGWVQARRERLDDPLGEIGVGVQRTDDSSISPGLRGTLGWAADPRLALTGLVELRGDRWVARDRLLDTEAPAATRTVGRASVGGTWYPVDRISLSPVIVGTRIESGGSGDAPGLGSVDPRAGLRVELSDALAITANLGRYLRPPDLTELYGDRGPLIGNPALRPERGVQGDLGLRWVGDAVRAELVAFDSRAVDRIVYVQNAQQVALPMNLGRSRVSGLEAAGSLQLGPLEAWTSATRTWSRQISDDPAYDGKELPRIPSWELHQRTALVGARGRIGHTVTWLAPTWFDAINWYRAAPRVLHGLFARLVDGPLSVEAEILNLTDRITEEVPRNPLADDGATAVQPVTDFVGQPLPGRTFLLTLGWGR